MDKARADFFFVPAYVKCVRIYGGLDEKEVSDYFMKVNPPLLTFLIFYAPSCNQRESPNQSDFIVGLEANALLSSIGWKRPCICLPKVYFQNL